MVFILIQQGSGRRSEVVGKVQEISFGSKIGLLRPFQNHKILGGKWIENVQVERRLENLDWVLT